MSRDRPRLRPKSYRLIIKSTKYYKYQKSILYMKRELYILRKICLLIEAIINITNNKSIGESIIFINIAESIISVIESTIGIFKIL